MSIYNKQSLYLALILSFGSLSYAAIENVSQQSVEQESIIQIARRHLREGKYNEAIEMLKEPSESGNPEAQCLLGCIQLQEKNDQTQAMYCWEKSALQGYSEAQYFLGSTYIREDSKERNEKKALFWLEKAAEQNHAAAQYMVGLIYFKERQDYERASFWFDKAAAQNHANAQYHLGVIYLIGLGVPQDYSKAFSFFGKVCTSRRSSCSI